jgi:uncharacterized protein
MPICPICDDTGLQNSDSTNPEFCFCAAGKQARRQWETSRAQANQGKAMPKAPSFIDIAQLEQVNASVNAMRASLLGSSTAEMAAQTSHPAVQLLARVAHPGHEITVTEATQLHDLAKVLEVFLSGLGLIGRNK